MESLKGLIAAAGKFEENKMFDKKFEGDVNFIVYTGKFESKTEKLGAMKVLLLLLLTIKVLTTKTIMFRATSFKSGGRWETLTNCTTMKSK